MTAGWSKGRKQYYLYYRCTEHTSYNLKGEMLHENFGQLLKALSFQPHQIRFIMETAKTMLIEPIKVNQERQKAKIEALKTVNDKIYKLEERLMNNEIETSTYQSWFKKLKEEKAVLELAFDDKKPKIDTGDDLIARVLPNLGSSRILVGQRKKYLLCG